ncbi:ABC-type spermidine/putrescine transport system [Fructobacillus fructosus]|uniref:ABC transporter permease n=1 Tax=Fructobacillus fructosus TaxID=1631 RepID=UPI002DA24D1F|nr:ABC-type spermidine/putrescine transport system [Fructobacillus fructosus]
MNSTKKGFTEAYLGVYGLWLLAFVVAPLLLLLIQSLNVPGQGLSLANYRDFFTSGSYLAMTVNSIWYAFLITVITLGISYPLALCLTKLKHRQFWLLLVILPTWINLLLKTYAFIGLLGKDGLLNQSIEAMGFGSQQLLFTNGAFLLVAAYIELPFMVLPIYNALLDIDPLLPAASRDLGASSFQTLKKVIWPLSMPGVKTGVQTVFIPSLSLFMITRLIGGNKVITLGTAIEEHFLVTQNWSFGSTIGVVLIIAMALTMALTTDRKKKKRRQRK